jgi:phosphatidylinositol alpha-mannosyltransferase
MQSHDETVPDTRYRRDVPNRENAPMLRIGMLCPYSLSLPGGVQMQVLGLARELRSMGHEVRVLGPCDGAPPEPFVTPLGKSLPTAANGSVAPIAPDPSAALRTIRALNDEAFDVLHLHEPIAPGITMTALMLRLAPTVGTFHAAGDSASYKYVNKPSRWLASRIDIRVAVSKDAELLASRYLGGSYEILGNGIEINRYVKEAMSVDKYAKAKTPTIFFCGRHEPRKGLDVLLRAMQFLPSDVELWIASDGSDTEKLKREWAHDQRVKWLGRINDDEKIRRMQEATVFCAPSLHGESFGVVLLEAMAAGTPVVASKIAGYQNVATHDVDALLVEPSDERGLASALAKVMTNSRLSTRLIEAGHIRVDESSMRNLAEKYVAVYRRALEMEQNGQGDGYAHRQPSGASQGRWRPSRMLALFEHRLLRK